MAYACSYDLTGCCWRRVGEVIPYGVKPILFAMETSGVVPGFHVSSKSGETSKFHSCGHQLATKVCNKW